MQKMKILTQILTQDKIEKSERNWNDLNRLFMTFNHFQVRHYQKMDQTLHTQVSENKGI